MDAETFDPRQHSRRASGNVSAGSQQDEQSYVQSQQSQSKQYPGISPIRPGEPATPRMLRNLSGSVKTSKTDILSQTTSPVDPQNSTFKEMEYEHSRSASFQKQQPIPPQANETPIQQVPPQHQGHQRVPSNGNPNRYHLSTSPAPVPPLQRRSELLPPAPIDSPAFDSKASSIVTSTQHTSTHHAPPTTPQQNGSSHEKIKQRTPQTSEPQPPHTPQPIEHQQQQSHQQQQQQFHQPQTHQPHSQQQQFHRKSIGDWDFIKTIGAGSMGKVKLAKHNTTKETCAVKIVPRAAKLYQRAHADDPPPSTPQEASQRHKEFEKELARDKRTIREGALGRLLFHPYICRLYEMVPMTNHYYMLFEHVQGGQMLDYIVAHGSLKEKNARKFARGIASALDYCHRNNVVHRDLKIENIMINEKGEIKIIDFGLSNLYSPKTLLKTYCGSLYFAAPELLCAKPYVGPEVDVWSFGVVLYVLVCGKVPFDDSSVSVLHEKIKRGAVEYPSFLSKECVSLLSRMLVVDPTKRATLYEVNQHPWMNKGYEYRVSSYIPKRFPLSLPLDPEIVKTISTFDLGTIEHITEELTNVLTSVEYQMSCENWYKVHEQGREYASVSNAHILPDPTGGFHPLISIHHLVDETKKRKRAKEEAARAQYQLAQQQAQEKQRLELVAQEQAKERAAQEAAHARRASQQLPQMPPQSYQTPPMQQQELPGISVPEQAHTSSIPTSFDRITNSTTAENSKLDSSMIPAQQPHSPRETSPSGDTLDPYAGKGTGINSLLRKLSSKKKTGQSMSPNRVNSDSPASNEVPQISFANAPPLPSVSLAQASPSKLSPQSSYSSKKDPMVRRGVSMKVTAKEKSSDSRVTLHASANSSNSHQAVESQKPSTRPVEPKKTTHGRTSSITNPNKFNGFIPVEYLPPLPNLNSKKSLGTSGSNDSNNLKLPGPKKMHPTARAKSVGGNVRKEAYEYGHRANANSQHHPPLPNSLAAQNSDEVVGDTSNNNDGFFDDVTLDDVEFQEIPQLTEEQIIEQFNEAKPNSMPSIEHCKTLFLKGFFSVQTTSTKPLPVIRYNIINVLSKLGVKFQEVKGGFVCAYTPSSQQPISRSFEEYSNDTNTNTEEDKVEVTSEEKKLYGDAFKSTSSSIEQDHPPRVRTPETSTSNHLKTPSRQPSLHLITGPSPSTSHKSHRSSNSIGGGHRRKFSIGNSILGSYRKKDGSQTLMPPNTPSAAKVRSLDYDENDSNENLRQYADDDSVDSLNNMAGGYGSDMLVSSRLEHKAKHQHGSSISSQAPKKSPSKFEIHIVKVPLVGLYGVQFKKLLGNTWNYKTLASQVLNELNL